MRVTLVTGGSRGDLQPYVALGEGLRLAGHGVTIATYGPYEAFVRSRGLEFAPLSGDPQGLMDHLLDADRGSGRHSGAWRLARRFGEALEPLAETNFEECLDACREADVVVYTSVGYLGYLAAQKLKVPTVGAALQPMFTPTRAFPSSLAPIFPGRLGPLGGAYNRLTYAATEAFFWHTFRRTVDDLRARKLGLPPTPSGGALREIRRKGVPVLNGWSPSVLPAPKDWAPWAHVTGYWFLSEDPNWRPPKALKAFLDNGPTPLCVGFGSMSNRSATHTTEAILRALRACGQRAVLLTGWGGLGEANLPEGVLEIEQAPHDWLFPRVRAVVHHGGAGTVAAGVRAGVPNVTVPFFSDQPFWGHRLARLGVGTAPIPHKRLSAERLTTALRQAVSDRGMQECAAALGRRVRSEEGVQNAIRVIEAHAREYRRGK
jgi:sterol 3beta-glucosyltransferase